MLNCYKLRLETSKFQYGAFLSHVSSQGLNQGPVVGATSINLAQFVSDAEQKELQLNIPLTSSGAADEPCPSLCTHQRKGRRERREGRKEERRRRKKGREERNISEQVRV